MPEPTTPRIFEAQNTEDSRRLVAAQARMYSDAKLIFFGRVTTVFLLSIATIIASALIPDHRTLVGGGGGIALFFGSFLAETIEKRKRMHAAATQEVFDTRVFKLPWNSILAQRPSSASVAQAARRYKGGRDKNWYDTTGETRRPFDVLTCQATNLGWGASMHFLWFCILLAVGLTLIATIVSVWAVAHLSLADALTVLLVPSLAPFKELISLIKGNIDSYKLKESTERTLNDLWESGLSGSRLVTESDLRQLQDRILIFRQTNAYVPDWLDTIFHERNESAMRSSVADRVAQAQRAGMA